jgi:hypothetical protein
MGWMEGIRKGAGLVSRWRDYYSSTGTKRSRCSS